VVVLILSNQLELQLPVLFKYGRKSHTCQAFLTVKYQVFGISVSGLDEQDGHGRCSAAFTGSAEHGSGGSTGCCSRNRELDKGIQPCHVLIFSPANVFDFRK
jgi:hypothetical protein